jgi:hypothetical protein
MSTVITWIKNNILISVGIGLVIVILFFGTGLKKIFRPRRVYHRRSSVSRIGVARSRNKTMRRSLPRSVGTLKASGRGYPKVGGGYIPFKRNKNGTVKKAQFVGGTVAARNRMARLRRSR